MAGYTMQLREYIESFSYDERLPVREVIERGRAELFDFDYPIFDEKYRNVFETNFIRNFYTREIGFETEGLFKFKLESWLLLNMPYYNKLFESELIEFNPLESYSLKTTYTRTADKTQNDIRDVEQLDNKTEQKNASVDTTAKSEDNSSTNLTTNRTQNDTSVGNVAENKSLNQNETTSNDSTTDASGTVKTNGKEDIEGNTHTLAKTDTTSDVEKDTTIETETEQDNFNRELRSDTPDSRLQISSSNGEGVIEYASQIVENKQLNKERHVNDTKEISSEHTVSETDSQTDESRTTTTENNEESNSLSKTTDVGSRLNTISETNNVNASENINSSSNETQNGSESKTILENGNTTINDLLNVDGTSKTNDKLNSKINDVEDYIEEKVGSIGVKTYSEMIQEYRSILLRIEKQIFEEMNELFMLVY